MQNSLNVVAVELLQKVGFDPVIETARSLGIIRPMGHFYPMAIGAYEQTVLDMTAAYAAIANRGVYVAPTPFEEILGPNGDLLWSRRVDGDRGRRAVASPLADAMLWMQQQVVKGGTGGGAALADRPVAGKTGTSESGRDLWFIGSIPSSPPPCGSATTTAAKPTAPACSPPSPGTTTWRRSSRICPCSNSRPSRCSRTASTPGQAQGRDQQPAGWFARSPPR
jgi:membrane peptidoglycan carboxypeptidase